MIGLGSEHCLKPSGYNLDLQEIHTKSLNDALAQGFSFGVMFCVCVRAKHIKTQYELSDAVKIVLYIEKYYWSGELLEICTVCHPLTLLKKSKVQS